MHAAYHSKEALSGGALWRVTPESRRFVVTESKFGTNNRFLGSAERSPVISDDAHVTGPSDYVSTFGGSDVGPMSITSQVRRLRVGPCISLDRAPFPPMPGIRKASASVANTFS